MVMVNEIFIQVGIIYVDFDIVLYIVALVWYWHILGILRDSYTALDADNRILIFKQGEWRNA